MSSYSNLVLISKVLRLFKYGKIVCFTHQANLVMLLAFN